jgi:hypothetical protein
MRAMWLVGLAFVLAGCFGVPGAVKTEIDFVDTVTQIAIKEGAEIEDAENRAEKYERALKRIAPHTDNLRRWAEGEESDAD